MPVCKYEKEEQITENYNWYFEDRDKGSLATQKLLKEKELAKRDSNELHTFKKKKKNNEDNLKSQPRCVTDEWRNR